jgi:type II secretory pathway component PulF
MVYWFRRKEELNCFRYYALDKNDQAAEGIIRAPTFEQAYQILDKKFPSLIRVEPASPDEIPEEVVVAQFKRIYWKIPVLPEFFFSFF